MKTQLSILALVFAGACTNPSDHSNPFEPEALGVGAMGQSLALIDAGGEHPSVRIELTDSEATVSGTDQPNVEAVEYECNSPQSDKDAEIERLADKFITSTNGTTVEAKLQQLEAIKLFVRHEEALICNDL